MQSVEPVRAARRLPFQIDREATQRLMIFGVLLLLMAVMSALSPDFATATNLTNVLRQTSMVIIAASAATLIMISGGLDISVGGVLALSGVVAAKMATMDYPLWLAILGGVTSGAIIGVING